jgi:hypothetical protein
MKSLTRAGGRTGSSDGTDAAERDDVMQRRLRQFYKFAHEIVNCLLLKMKLIKAELSAANCKI